MYAIAIRRGKAARTIGAKVAAAVAIATAAATSAHAALPAGVTTAIDEYKDDALMALALVISAGVAIWGLRKLGQKLGWF